MAVGPALRTVAIAAVVATAIVVVALRGPDERPLASPTDVAVVATATPLHKSAAAHPSPALAAIVGRVVDERGHPVAGTTIRALAPDSRDERGHAASGDDGRFAIGSLPLGPVRLYAHSGRHRPAWAGPIALDRPGEAEEITIRLATGRAIAGRVSDPEGRPVPGAYVGASDEGAALAVTDATGRFELGGLGEAPVNLFATAPGWATRHLRGVPPGAHAVEFVLERPGRLQGRIAPGAAARVLRVDLCHHDAHFDREICVASRRYDPPAAAFELRDLPSGRFDLVLDGDGAGAVRVPVTIAAGVAVDVGEIALGR